MTYFQSNYTLHPKMIVLHPGVLCPKIVIRDQMFIDFFDVIKKINKHLISDYNFGIENSMG